VSTPAEQLGITSGLVWVIGRSDEENAVLDPLPDGVDTVTDPDDSTPEQQMSAVVLVIDDLDVLAEDLDDALPRIGSVPSVWIVASHELDLDAVAGAVSDYGWSAAPPIHIDSGWAAVRIAPA